MCGLDHSFNAFALAQVASQNRFPFDTLLLSRSFFALSFQRFFFFFQKKNLACARGCQIECRRLKTRFPFFCTSTSKRKASETDTHSCPKILARHAVVHFLPIVEVVWADRAVGALAQLDMCVLESRITHMLSQLTTVPWCIKHLLMMVLPSVFTTCLLHTGPSCQAYKSRCIFGRSWCEVRQKVRSYVDQTSRTSCRRSVRLRVLMLVFVVACPRCVGRLSARRFVASCDCHKEPQRTRSREVRSRAFLLVTVAHQSASWKHRFAPGASVEQRDGECQSSSVPTARLPTRHRLSRLQLQVPSGRVWSAPFQVGSM